MENGPAAETPIVTRFKKYPRAGRPHVAPPCGSFSMRQGWREGLDESDMHLQTLSREILGEKRGLAQHMETVRCFSDLTINIL